MLGNSGFDDARHQSGCDGRRNATTRICLEARLATFAQMIEQRANMDIIEQLKLIEVGKVGPFLPGLIAAKLAIAEVQASTEFISPARAFQAMQVRLNEMIKAAQATQTEGQR